MSSPEAAPPATGRGAPPSDLDPAGIDVGDGLVLRRATEADVEGIVALSVAAHGAREEAGVRRLVERPDAGIDAWLVVVDGDRVVATSAGLSPTFLLDGVALPVGQIEYVATVEEHRNRGLIRAIFSQHEREARDRGALLHLVEGIPYFYRVLGYGYGLGHAPLVEVAKGTRDAPPGEAGRGGRGRGVPGSGGAGPVSVTLGTPADLAELRPLQERVQARCELVRPWTDHDWPSLLPSTDDPREQLLVARRGPTVCGFGRLMHYPPFGVELTFVATTDEAAAGALLDAGLDAAGGEPLYTSARPGDPMEVVAARRGKPWTGFLARYTKVPDAFRLLTTLRPVLERRLARSSLAGATGELVLSLYRTSVVLRYHAGSLTLDTAPGHQDPPEDGVPGVPPDWLAALALGRFDPAELEARVDDVWFGEHLPVVQALFPAVRADVDWPL